MMKEFTLAYDDGSRKRNLTCFVPQDWEDVSWKQFGQIQQTLDRSDLTPLEAGLLRASILTGVRVADLELCDFRQVVPMMDSITFIKDLPEPDIAQAESVFTIDGTRYHACDIQDTRDLTAFDKIDAAEALSFSEKVELKMALFLRPELPPKKWYQFWVPTPPEPRLEPILRDDKLIERRRRLFTDSLTVVQVVNLAAFFIKAAVASQIPTPTYGLVANSLLRQSGKMERLFGRVMGGSPSSTIYSRILWSLKRRYVSLSTSYFRALNTEK